MQPFLLLLLLAYSVTLTFTSAVSPNILGRDVAMTSYTIAPVDSANTANIESRLNQYHGDSNIVTNRQDGRIVSWTFTSSNQDVVSFFESIEGVQSVYTHSAPERTPRDELATPDQSESLETSTHEAIQNSRELSRRDTQLYNALAVEGSDFNETEAFLRSKVQEPDKIQQHKLRGSKEVTGWWWLVLDADAIEEVKKHKGIVDLEVMKMMTFDRSLAAADWTSLYQEHRDPSHKDAVSLRSAGEWEKQGRGDKALVMDSQYDGIDLDKLTDFVHVAEPGKGIFVYVIDQGIKVDVANTDGYEFHPPDDDPNKLVILQSAGSRLQGETANVDESGHGTAVACKAVGTKFGLAKKATVVPVKFSGLIDDWQNTLDLILDDLESHPGREKHSVVVTSAGASGYTVDEIRRSPKLQKWFQPSLDSILGLSVPFVCAAGNDGKDGTPIDKIPALFQEPSVPLIVVGSNEYDGSRSDFSQLGPQLTIYAPGRQVEVQTLLDFRSQKVDGTSYATPQVGGLIATYLAYDQKPWDDSLQGVDRVKAIRNYLLTQRSSWIRKPDSGVRIIWNGAGKEQHESAGTNDAGSPAPAISGPAKGKALSIILQTSMIPAPPGRGDIYTNNWLYFAVKRGETPHCRPDGEALVKPNAGGGIGALTNSNLKLPDHQVLHFEGTLSSCEYKNDGKGNPGKLWCGGTGFDCFFETQEKLDCGNGFPGTLFQQPKVHCEWSD